MSSSYTKTDLLVVNSGTVTAPSIYFDSNPGTGIYSSAPNVINFTISGVSKWSIDSSGQSTAVGNLLFSPDNTYDIGTGPGVSPAYRPRNIYATGSIATKGIATYSSSVYALNGINGNYLGLGSASNTAFSFSLAFHKARGTTAAPTAVQSNDLLGSILAGGNNTVSSQPFVLSGGSIGQTWYAQATENWTASAAGNRQLFGVIKNLSLVGATSLCLENNGNVILGFNQGVGPTYNFSLVWGADGIADIGSGDSGATMNRPNNFYLKNNMYIGGTIGANGSYASGVVQDITYTALAPGLLGNNISIQYSNLAIAGSEVVIVSGSFIQVNIQNNVSTANQVLTAINNSAPALALIHPVLSGSGSNAQYIFNPAQFLTGGTFVSAPTSIYTQNLITSGLTLGGNFLMTPDGMYDIGSPDGGTTLNRPNMIYANGVNLGSLLLGKRHDGVLPSIAADNDGGLIIQNTAPNGTCRIALGYEGSPAFYIENYAPIVYRVRIPSLGSIWGDNYNVISQQGYWGRECQPNCNVLRPYSFDVANRLRVGKTAASNYYLYGGTLSVNGVDSYDSFLKVTHTGLQTTVTATTPDASNCPTYNIHVGDYVYTYGYSGNVARITAVTINSPYSVTMTLSAPGINGNGTTLALQIVQPIASFRDNTGTERFFIDTAGNSTFSAPVSIKGFSSNTVTPPASPSTYVILPTDDLIRLGDSMVGQLPLATGSGKIYMIKYTGLEFSPTIATSGSDTVSGVSSATWNASNPFGPLACLIISDGSSGNWDVISFYPAP